MVRELHAFTRKAVDIWGQEFRLPIAGEVAVACVIEKDVNDVRFFQRAGCHCSERQTGKQKAGESTLHSGDGYDRAGSFIQRFFRQETNGYGLHVSCNESAFWDGSK